MGGIIEEIEMQRTDKIFNNFRLHFLRIVVMMMAMMIIIIPNSVYIQNTHQADAQ